MFDRVFTKRDKQPESVYSTCLYHVAPISFKPCVSVSAHQCTTRQSVIFICVAFMFMQDRFVRSLLIREEMEYDVYPQENYRACYYGQKYWLNQCNVDELLRRHVDACNQRPREPTTDDPEHVIHINRFRVRWLNLHVISSFWRTLSVFTSVQICMKTPGVIAQLSRLASMPTRLIEAAVMAQDTDIAPAHDSPASILRDTLNTLHMVTRDCVGTNGYRRFQRHAGMAYSLYFGPPMQFVTPNLADGRNVLLVMLQGQSVDMEIQGPEVTSYNELRRRLSHDPVGQTILFELTIDLFYRHLLGVRKACISKDRAQDNNERFNVHKP